MTQIISRGAANQVGARIDTDAYDKAADFLPLIGIDHVEFWVGNARQAAAYYRALWGFTPVAFSGLETKVRDRASYVMVQNDIRFVFTAPLTPDGEIADHVRAHGDVTPDELADARRGTGYDLAMTAAVNGVETSRGRWSDAQFSFGEMLARASADVRLRPGDLIGSGTVGTGCLLEVRDATLGRYLEPGDRVTLRIERLGALTSPVVMRSTTSDS